MFTLESCAGCGYRQFPGGYKIRNPLGGCLNACESYMSKKFDATESLRYKGVATLSSGDMTTDWSARHSVIL